MYSEIHCKKVVKPLNVNINSNFYLKLAVFSEQKYQAKRVALFIIFATLFSVWLITFSLLDYFLKYTKKIWPPHMYRWKGEKYFNSLFQEITAVL